MLKLDIRVLVVIFSTIQLAVSILWLGRIDYKQNEQRESFTNELKEVEGRYEKFYEDLALVDEKLTFLTSTTSSDKLRWARIEIVKGIVKSVAQYSELPSGCTFKLTSDETMKVSSGLVDAADEHKVPLSLAVAVAKTESNFYQCARSRSGAIGIMQIMPDTGKRLEKLIGKKLKITHTRDNLYLGMFYLSSLLEEFQGNAEHAVKAYNAGPEHVHKVISGQAKCYAETASYWKDVASAYQQNLQKGL